MPEWIICDLDGNELSVDLTKTSINSIDDVKEQFEKFDKQATTSKKNIDLKKEEISSEKTAQQQEVA